MDTHNSEIPSLPAPQLPPGESQSGYVVNHESSSLKTPETVKATNPSVLGSIQNPQPQQQAASQHVVNSSNSATQSTDDDLAIADDVDVIEPAWVKKAKQVVAATKNDPHQQEKEVSRLQADYLLKRYNKQIKTSEQ